MTSDGGAQELLGSTMRVFLSGSTDLAFVKNRDFVYEAGSEAFAHMAGCSSAAELVGKTDRELFPKAIADRYHADDLQVIMTGEPLLGYKDPLPGGEGDRQRWGQTSKYPVRGDDGEIVGVYGICRDVTRATELEGMGLNVALIDNVPCGVALLRLVDDDLLFDYANESLFRAYHIPPREKLVAGKSLFDLMLDEDRASARDLLRRVWQGREFEVGVNYRVAGADGLTYWVNTQLKHAFVNDGMSYFLASVIDVTRQKHAEEQERRGHQIATSLLDAMAEEYITSARVNITENMVEQVTGADAIVACGPYDDAVETIASHMVRQRDRDALLERFSRASVLGAFSRGITNVAVDAYTLRSNGRPRWVRESLDLVQDVTSGDVIAVLGVSDINDAKITELIGNQVLMEKYEAITYLRGELGSGVILREVSGVVDEGPFEDWSSMVSQMSVHVDAASLDEFLAFHDLRNVRADLDATGQHSNVFWWRWGDGANREALTALRGDSEDPTEDDGLRYMRADYYYLDQEARLLVYTREDVTDAYAKEARRRRELAAALAEAQEANAAKTDFLSRMSHDFLTPLNGIIGMGEVARKSDSAAEKDASIEKMQASGRELLGLVTDILDFSKAEGGWGELYPEPIPREEFEDYFTSVVEPICTDKGLALTSTIDFGTALPVADERCVSRILLNLVSNAIKFTETGGSVGCSVTLGEVAGGRGTMTLEVSDTGVGMSEQFQRRLFEPFSQEGRVDVDEHRGTGLGLAIVWRLVNVLEGTIDVQSELGRGSIFTVRFACDVLESETAPSEVPLAADGDALLDGAHILLCEDHPVNAEIALFLLGDKGASVDHVTDGKQGLERFSASEVGHYDAILMDMRMPEMDGLEATRAIRDLDRPDAHTVPIVAMTANSLVSDVENCLAAGMDAHLAKPYEPEQLYGTLAALIARRR